MKPKIRYLTLKATDQHNLEVLLNAYAQEGWHIKQKTWNFLIFEYDPQRNRRYTVLTDYSVFKRTNKADDIYDLTLTLEHLESFDYRIILRTQCFVILDKPSDSDYITDIKLEETVSQPKRSILYKSIKKTALFNLIYYSVMFVFVIGQSFPDNILSNSGILMTWIWLMLFVYILVSNLLLVRFGYMYSKNYENPVPKKFTITKNNGGDILDLLFFIILFSMIIGGAALAISGEFIIIQTIGSGIFIILTIYFVIQIINSEERGVMMILRYILPMMLCILCIFFIMQSTSSAFDGTVNNGEINDSTRITALNLESFERMLETDNQCYFYQTDSLLASSVELYCDQGTIKVYYAKYDWVIPILSKVAADTTTIPEHEIVRSNDGLINAFRSGRYILISYREIPQIFIDEIMTLK